jgi:hypothetical protein
MPSAAAKVPIPDDQVTNSFHAAWCRRSGVK